MVSIKKLYRLIEKPMIVGAPDDWYPSQKKGETDAQMKTASDKAHRDTADYLNKTARPGSEKSTDWEKVLPNPIETSVPAGQKVLMGTEDYEDPDSSYDIEMMTYSPKHWKPVKYFEMDGRSDITLVDNNSNYGFLRPISPEAEKFGKLAVSDAMADSLDELIFAEDREKIWNKHGLDKTLGSYRG